MPDHLNADASNDRICKVGVQRFKALSPLAAAERNTHAAVEAVANELGIGRPYCYRLLRRLRADPSVTAVLPRPRGRSTGSRTLDTKVEATIAAAIEQLLGRQQPPVAVLVREIAQRCAEQGLKAPTYKAVAVRVHAFSQSEAPRCQEEAAVMHQSRGVVGFLNDPDLGSPDDDVLAKEIAQRQEINELCRHVWEHSDDVAQDVPIRLLRSAGIPHQLELEHQARWSAAAALVIRDSARRFAAERRESRNFYQRLSADARSLRHRLSSQSADSECPYYATQILVRLETWSTQRTAEAPSTNRIRGQAARALAVEAMRLFIAAFRSTPTVYIGGPARLFLSEAFNLVERQAKRKDIMVRVPSASSVLSLVKQATNEAQTGPVPYWQHLLGIGPQ